MYRAKKKTGFRIIAVTNRSLCTAGGLKNQVAQLAAAGAGAVILREKELSPLQYALLAKEIRPLCEKHQVSCIPHYFWEEALYLGFEQVHLPLSLLEEHPKVVEKFRGVGVSVHSLADARRAVDLGAGYLIAGHIFATDCKKGRAPRGLDFLQEICREITLPVYGIGGIHEGNIGAVCLAGAAGACLMSTLMASENVSEELGRLSQASRVL